MMRSCKRMNVSVVLMGIILFLCILGACAQNGVGRRRGRIIRRFHSNELVIPSHLQQNAIDMRTGKKYIPKNCRGDCPPKWIEPIHKLHGLNLNISHPLCEFSHVFSQCYGEGDACPRNRVEFTCCPTNCMPSVEKCYGQTPEFLCVPKSIQPWLQIMFRLNIWGPQ